MRSGLAAKVDKKWARPESRPLMQKNLDLKVELAGDWSRRRSFLEQLLFPINQRVDVVGG